MLFYWSAGRGSVSWLFNPFSRGLGVALGDDAVRNQVVLSCFYSSVRSEPFSLLYRKVVAGAWDFTAITGRHSESAIFAASRCVYIL